MITLDIRNLENFDIQMVELVKKKLPAESKKFLRKQGGELNKETKTLAKSRIGKNGKGKKKKPAKKRYLSGFKKGKAYKHEPTESFAIRVYNNRPHAHLLEYGHNQLDKDKKPVKYGKRFVEGRSVLQDAEKTYEEKFYKEVNDFVDEFLKKGLGT